MNRFMVHCPTLGLIFKMLSHGFLFHFLLSTRIIAFALWTNRGASGQKSYLSLQLHPAFKGPQQSHLINIFQVAADRNSTGDPAHLNAGRFDQLT